MNNELPIELSELIRKIAKNPNVAAIYLFGSYANGRVREDSDIDVAVILKKPNEKDEDFVSRFRNYIFDVHSFHKLPLIIQFRIIREGELLFVNEIEGEKYLQNNWINVVRKYLDFKPIIHKFYRRVIENV